MTITTILLIGAAVFVAAFAQGSTGMGFAMILAPVVTLLHPSLIPVMLLMLMIPLNIYIGQRERGHVDWRGVKWISAGRFVGTFAGLWILLSVSLHQLALLIGGLTILAAVAALLAPAFDPNRPGLALVGLATGITETSTGVGGPPLALAYQHKGGPTLRSTVALCFLVGEIISLIVLCINGRVDVEILLTAIEMLPFLAFGCFVSKFVHHRLDGPLVRYIVLGFAIASGITVIIQA